MSESYWSKKNILRYNPHTNIFESIIMISFFFEELAFDHIGNNIYGINEAGKSIVVYSIKTKAMTVFYFTHYPTCIALAPEERC